MQPEGSLNWWETRAFAAAAMLAALIPFLWPTLPPLTDLPGHMGRYSVALDLAESPTLRRFYDFQWTLVGNLGVDLLVMPLGRLLGVETATRLIASLIPAFTIGGMLWLARELHGRIPATALLALPLAFAWPFQFGFLNYCLGVALALYAIAFWLRLGRLGKTRLRAILFVPISFLIWLCHILAWGPFGLAIFAIELVGGRQAGRSWPRSLFAAILACLPLALPLLIVASWWSNAPSGVTASPGGWPVKILFFISLLRSDWMWFDLFCASVLFIAVAFACLRDKLSLEPRLGLAALLVLGAYLAMPSILLGAAYSDMRLVPFLFILAVLAIRPTERLSPALVRAAALAAVALFAARIAYHSWTYVRLDLAWAEQIAAIDHIPQGGRVYVQVAIQCNAVWDARRVDHLDGLAIVRRQAFTNGQWPMPGGKLLSVVYAPARGFDLDPGQMLWPIDCEEGEQLPVRLAKLPRDAFDFVWLIDVEPARQANVPWLAPVWRGPDGRGVLYRIVR